jgi:hypothetical protein
MPDHSLIIAFPAKNPSHLQRLLSSQRPVPYLYFGVNYSTLRNLEKKLGNEFTRLDIAKLHDQVAEAIRAEHVAWIDGLNREYGADIEWWFGLISSRNIFKSKLFQHSCYLEILARIWDIPERRPRLIFTESVGLARAIKKWALEQGIAAHCCDSMVWQPLSDYFFSFLKWGYFALGLLMRQIAARASRKDLRPHKNNSRDLAIVDTFVHDSCLTEAGVFTDRYFPYLHEFLAARGIGVLVHPVLYGFGLHFLSVYRRMRRSETRFIIPEDFLRTRDYLSILTYPLRAGRRKIRAPRFRGFDLADLISEEQRNLTDGLSLTACLIYRLFLRLGESSLRPRLVINWYENQVIDKALIAAARWAFPQAQLVGAQICLYSYNVLFLFPIQSEVEAGIVPHLLLGMSEHLCNFAQTFTKDIPCRPAAALRYAYIFRERQATMAATRGSAVVVLLPHDLIESAEMLEILKMGLNRIQKEARLLIKCHPDFTPLDLKRAFGEQQWPERFEFYQGTLTDAVKVASAVISSNSGSIVEAAAFGIPVIFLGRQTALNNNVLEGFESELIIECFTEKDLVIAINRCLNLTKQEVEQYKALGERILNLFFLPVIDETMVPFLGDISNNP